MLTNKLLNVLNDIIDISINYVYIYLMYYLIF